MIALLACLQAHLGFERLAVGSSLRAVLDAVVDRIANQVNDRIGKILDHGLVDLGIPAGEDQLHVLPKLRARSRAMRGYLGTGARWLHPGLHDCVLQVGYQQVELTTATSRHARFRVCLLFRMSLLCRALGGSSSARSRPTD